MSRSPSSLRYRTILYLQTMCHPTFSSQAPSVLKAQHMSVAPPARSCVQHAAEAPTKQQEQAPTLEPGTTGMSASVCAMQSAHSSGRRSMHSAVSSDGSSKMFTEVRCWSGTATAAESAVSAFLLVPAFTFFACGADPSMSPQREWLHAGTSFRQSTCRVSQCRGRHRPLCGSQAPLPGQSRHA